MKIGAIGVPNDIESTVLNRQNAIQNTNTYKISMTYAVRLI